MFETATESLGGLDGVVMNLGIGAGFGIAGTSVEEWDHVMAVNLRSHFLGCKHGLAAMGADGGAIVLLGSIASREVMPFPAYAASKAALESSAARPPSRARPRCAPTPIPGLIDTSLGRLASRLSPRATRSGSRRADRAAPGRSPTAGFSCSRGSRAT